MIKYKKLEKDFQSCIIKELKSLLPGVIIIKTDPNYIQGFPDLLILYDDKWAALECKRNVNSYIGPNQIYYIDIMNKLSFARFINPENKEEVLDDLQKSFGVTRSSCIPVGE